MKENWNEKNIGDVCLKTSNLNWNENTEESFEYVDLSSVSRDLSEIVNSSRINNQNAPSRARKIIRTGDVIFATTRPTLKRAAIVPQVFDNQICSTGFTVLRKNDDLVLPEYLFYFLNSDEFMQRMEKLQRGASYPAVTDSDVKKTMIRIPHIEEQKEIITILDQAFAAIDQAQANIQQNLQNAQDLFQSKLNQIFSQQGEGWKEKTLGDVCENLDNKRIPITKNKRKEGKIPYYGASGIVDYVDDYIFDEDLLLVSEDGANLLARTYPIAFSVSGKIWVNNHAHVLKFESIDSQSFVEYYLNSIKLDNYISGMAQPKLNQKKLNSIKIPYPDIDIQKETVREIDALKSDITELEQAYKLKIINLEELKRSLLQKAFSGELTQEKQVA